MKKAIEIDGQIKVYNQIPSNWDGKINYSSPNNSDEQIADGWKDFVEPTLEKHEVYGDIILDEVNDRYMYDVIDMPLEDLKELRIDEVDNRTKELIFSGFTYDSNIFSMSVTAQINVTNILNVPVELFPLPYSTKDNGVYTLELVNRNDFYLAALNHKNDSIQSGTVLKQQILACSTVAEVNAIIDNR